MNQKHHWWVDNIINICVVLCGREYRKCVNNDDIALRFGFIFQDFKNNSDGTEQGTEGTAIQNVLDGIKALVKYHSNMRNRLLYFL